MSKERDDALELLREVYEAHCGKHGLLSTEQLNRIARSLKGPSPSHDHSECERELRIARTQNALASPSPESTSERGQCSQCGGVWRVVDGVVHVAARPDCLLCHGRPGPSPSPVSGLTQELTAIAKSRLDGCFCDDADGNCNPPHAKECDHCAGWRSVLALLDGRKAGK